MGAFGIGELLWSRGTTFAIGNIVVKEEFFTSVFPLLQTVERLMWFISHW